MSEIELQRSQIEIEGTQLLWRAVTKEQGRSEPHVNSRQRSSLIQQTQPYDQEGAGADNPAEECGLHTFAARGDVTRGTANALRRAEQAVVRSGRNALAG